MKKIQASICIALFALFLIPTRADDFLPTASITKAPVEWAARAISRVDLQWILIETRSIIRDPNGNIVADFVSHEWVLLPYGYGKRADIDEQEQ